MQDAPLPGYGIGVVSAGRALRPAVTTLSKIPDTVTCRPFREFVSSDTGVCDLNAKICQPSLTQLLKLVLSRAQLVIQRNQYATFGKQLWKALFYPAFAGPTVSPSLGQSP